MLRVSLAVGALLTIATANAEQIRFNTDPFAGTNVLATPGRQVVGNELFLPVFNLGTDVFSFDPAVFNVSSVLSFANATAGNLPTSGVNVVVLQTTDDDNNLATPFGAGNAANLIAAQINQPGAGFFIYLNSNLNVARLVYSTDLNDNTADLKILARMLSPTGVDAATKLPNFAAGNFEIVAAPEPSSMVLMGAGLVLAAIGSRGRLRKRKA